MIDGLPKTRLLARRFARSAISICSQSETSPIARCAALTARSTSSSLVCQLQTETREAAGFRPCLRCRPEAAPFSPAWKGARATVERALRLIAGGALDVDGVEALAGRLGVGARHLNRLFQKHLGASPVQVAQTRRVQRAKRLLDETAFPMAEIAMLAGFGSLRRFNAVFAEVYRRPPTEIRRATAARLVSNRLDRSA